MTKLIEHKAPRPRFARSINVERDSGSSAVDSYLPVGRAIDAITRLANALDSEDVEAAISITGPYGSGKSSLAVVLDALFGPARDHARESAEELLEHTSPDALARVASARQRLQADELGFIRAVVTAQREPIVATVLRALQHGAERFRPAAADKSALARMRRTLTTLNRDLEGGSGNPRSDSRRVCALIEELTNIAPVLLLIDEFGKNLEAFAEEQSDSDLFLLQELAERTRGPDRIPLAIVTLQHLAFDEYPSAVSQRREWAKVQGRFEDIAFVDSAAQTRALVSAAFGTPSAALQQAQVSWASQEAARLRAIGLTDLAADQELIANCWPLHPVALAALPELCERYGQNERTLFSFLAGHELQSVSTFLRQTAWSPPTGLPVVRLDRLYDYFIEAAANLASVSSNASRWVEIDGRIRDAVGLSPAARRVLKAIGLLNLVSAGGMLRASKALVTYAAADGQPGTRNPKEIAARLRELEKAGLVTFRDFADEYRIWHGSDFDLRSAVEVARRRVHEVPASTLLERVFPLGPLVAARHSHETGTLRAFARAWVDGDVGQVEPLGPPDRADGLVLYVLGASAPLRSLGRRAGEKPTAFVAADSSAHLEEAAREVAALDEVLAQSTELTDDWVARRELLERRVEALAELARTFHSTFASLDTQWVTTKPKRRRWTSRTTASGSSVLSDMCDAWYSSAPTIRNDIVNRHELSSQAAKARRILLERMSAAPAEECLGIEGFGPDYTLYMSILQAHGLHRVDRDSTWAFMEPYERSDLRPVWNEINRLIAEATMQRRGLADLYQELSAPPFGLRVGVAPIIVTAALTVGREEVAVYEHGTFRPTLSDDVLERLLRNPDNFEVKHFASRSGERAEFLTQLADAFSVEASRGTRTGRVGSVLAVVSHLVALANALPSHIKKTKYLSSDALGVRRAVLQATEPDELLFSDVPRALGFSAIAASAPYPLVDIAEITRRVFDACTELDTAYPSLLVEVEAALRRFVGPTASVELRKDLAARARELDGKIIDGSVARLASALSADIPDREGWLSYVAMNVSGAAPEGWTDEDRDRFFVAVCESGGAFRRLHALNANLDARGDGFDAYRSVVTRTDGVEVVQVVAIDETIRAAGEPVTERALRDLSLSLGVPASEARAILVGLLGEQDLSETYPESAAPAVRDVYPGNVETTAR